MALNVLAYNMKRVIAIVGVGSLLEARTIRGPRRHDELTPKCLRVLTRRHRTDPEIFAARRSQNRRC
jgi:hypothetical protein